MGTRTTPEPEFIYNNQPLTEKQIARRTGLTYSAVRGRISRQSVPPGRDVTDLMMKPLRKQTQRATYLYKYKAFLNSSELADIFGLTVREMEAFLRLCDFVDCDNNLEDAVWLDDLNRENYEWIMARLRKDANKRKDCSTTPIRKGNRKEREGRKVFLYNGKKATVLDISKQTNTAPTTIYSKISKAKIKWGEEVSGCLKPKKTMADRIYQYKGEELPLGEISLHCGIPLRTLGDRIRERKLDEMADVTLVAWA